MVSRSGKTALATTLHTFSGQYLVQSCSSALRRLLFEVCEGGPRDVGSVVVRYLGGGTSC